MDALRFTEEEEREVKKKDRQCGVARTFIKDYEISTIYRQSSAMMNNPPWYYESIIWKGGHIVFMASGGHLEACIRALKEDFRYEGEEE